MNYKKTTHKLEKMDTNGRNQAEIGEKTTEIGGGGRKNELFFSGGGIKLVHL